MYVKEKETEERRRRGGGWEKERGRKSKMDLVWKAENISEEDAKVRYGANLTKRDGEGDKEVNARGNKNRLCAA